jgi:hypothetical protein
MMNNRSNRFHASTSSTNTSSSARSSSSSSGTYRSRQNTGSSFIEDHPPAAPVRPLPPLPLFSTNPSTQPSTSTASNHQDQAFASSSHRPITRSLTKLNQQSSQSPPIVSPPTTAAASATSTTSTSAFANTKSHSNSSLASSANRSLSSSSSSLESMDTNNSNLTSTINIIPNTSAAILNNTNFMSIINRAASSSLANTRISKNRAKFENEQSIQKMLVDEKQCNIVNILEKSRLSGRMIRSISNVIIEYVIFIFLSSTLILFKKLNSIQIKQ